MTALLEYLNLDCSIIVFQIIDAIELSSPSQLQRKKPHNLFTEATAPPCP